MAFHLGKPILVMICLALVGSAAMALRPQPKRADLEIWCFAESHAKTYRDRAPDGGPSLTERYQARTGKSVRVNLIVMQAMDIRLVSLFMGGGRGEREPDLAETEIGSLGKYFRPPVDEVGFLPLNDFLEKSGDIHRILPARLATCSKLDPRTGKEVIFGIPHDMHPVGITYRKDLFDEAGVDLAEAKTWPQFQEKCLSFQAYWAAHGYPRRSALELSRTGVDQLMPMLLQRHINLLDQSNQQHLTDPKVVDTLVFYAQLVEGPRRIGAETTPGGNAWVDDFARGDVCALMTPDWRSNYVKLYSPPSLIGKAALMALPRFDPDDAPTSSWGGTMIGIPRRAVDPQASWDLLRFLYFSPEGLKARRYYADILPPEPDLWKDPAYHQPDAFYGGQKIDEIYTDLARDIPARYVTPFSSIAQIGLTLVVNDAVTYARDRGTKGLDDACRTWLAEAAHDVERRVQFDQFQD